MKLKLDDIKELREEQGLTFVSFGEDDHVRELLFNDGTNPRQSVQPSVDERANQSRMGDLSGLPQEENLPKLLDGAFERGREYVLESMTPEMRELFEAEEREKLRLASA
jgi:hypothetical protein